MSDSTAHSMSDLKKFAVKTAVIHLLDNSNTSNADPLPPDAVLDRVIGKLKPGHAAGSALAFCTLPQPVAHEWLTDLGWHDVSITVTSAQALAKVMAFFGGLVQLPLAYYYAANDNAREELYIRLTKSDNPVLPFTAPDINLAMLALSTAFEYEFQNPELAAKVAEFRETYKVPAEAREAQQRMCRSIIAKLGKEPTAGSRLAGLVMPDIVDHTKKVLDALLARNLQPVVQRVLRFAGHSNIKLNKGFCPFEDTATQTHLAFMTQFQRSPTAGNRRQYSQAHRSPRRNKAGDNPNDEGGATKAQVQAQPATQDCNDEGGATKAQVQSQDPSVVVQAQSVAQGQGQKPSDIVVQAQPATQDRKRSHDDAKETEEANKEDQGGAPKACVSDDPGRKTKRIKLRRSTRCKSKRSK